MNSICSTINRATQMRKINMAQLYKLSGLPQLMRLCANKSSLKKKKKEKKIDR